MKRSLRRRTLSALLLLTLAAAGGSCRKNKPAPPTPAISTTLSLPANSQEITAASNRFAFDLFGTVLQQDPSGGNKLVSPLSIYMAISMLYNGSANATKDSITKTLELSGISIDRLNALSKALIQQMPSEDNKVTLSIANSIWYQQSGPQPLPAFLDTIKNDYNGTIKSLDFKSPASIPTINSWVSQNTNQKIPSIINSLNPDDVMVLINAIYFNGAWSSAFKTADTHNDVFHLANGQTVDVPFMNQQIALRTRLAPTFTLAEIPYGTGKGFSMYLVIPANPQQSITSFAASFTADSLADALSRMGGGLYQLSLPRWEYSYAISDLKPNLTKLGMGIAWTHADFSNMYQAPTSLSEAIHKTYIKVSEEGTEAAATTDIGVRATSAPAIFPLKVDRPFLYFIVEKQTGTILFTGIVNDPSKN